MYDQRYHPQRDYEQMSPLKFVKATASDETTFIKSEYSDWSEPEFDPNNTTDPTVELVVERERIDHYVRPVVEQYWSTCGTEVISSPRYLVSRKSALILNVFLIQIPLKFGRMQKALLIINQVHS